MIFYNQTIAIFVDGLKTYSKMVARASLLIVKLGFKWQSKLRRWNHIELNWNWFFSWLITWIWGCCWKRKVLGCLCLYHPAARRLTVFNGKLSDIKINWIYFNLFDWRICNAINAHLRLSCFEREISYKSVICKDQLLSNLYCRL